MSGGPSSAPAPAGNTTTIQKSDPWSGQQPYLAGGGSPGGSTGAPGQAGLVNPGTYVPGVLPSAASLYENYAPSYFPNSTVAPFNPLQQTGQSLEAGIGLGGGNPSVGASTNFLTGLENGNYLATNPFSDATAQSVMSQVVPGIEGTFNGGNRINSPGAAFAASQGAANALAPLEYQNYQNTLDEMLKGSALSPGLQSATYQNAGAVQDAGNQQQTQAQAQLNDAINRWNFQQQLPYNLLGNYDQLVSGNYGGTSTLTQPYFGPSATSNLLGGGLAGAGIGSMIAPALGLGSGMGALGGAGLGALLAFSDRRLKEDIQPVGYSTNGLPIYLFRYKGTNEFRIGLMADDVEKMIPGAVFEDKGGFKVVDYGMAFGVTANA